MRAQGLQCSSGRSGCAGGAVADVELCLFRIVQEALNNVVKHSGARVAQVSLRGDGRRAPAEHRDAGRGFDEAVQPSDGLGLASMRERLRLIGGEVMIKSSPGRGTTVDARVRFMGKPHDRPRCAGRSEHVDGHARELAPAEALPQWIHAGTPPVA